MELTGRLTADSNINVTKDDRKVVQFTIAMNDQYKKKGAGPQQKL